MTYRLLGRTGIRVSPLNLRALDVSFTEAELKRIDAISPPGRHTVSFYEAEFGPNARWI